MKLINKAILLLLLGCIIVVSCDPEEVILPHDNNGLARYGTIELDFPIDDLNLPLRCIKRTDLSISYTADSLYKKKYITVANVSDHKQYYKLTLEPGRYYFQAAKTCICGGDTCLWGGYAGGQNGLKWTMGSFNIIRDEAIYDRLTFD